MFLSAFEQPRGLLNPAHATPSLGFSIVDVNQEDLRPRRYPGAINKQTNTMATGWMLEPPASAHSTALDASVLATLTKELGELVGLLSEDGVGWRKEKSPLPDVEIWSRDAPGTSLRMFRARGRLPVSPDRAAKALVDQETRIKWDDSYEGCKDLVMFDDSACQPTAPLVRRTTIQHFWLKPVPGISQRDFVAYQMLEADTERGIYVACGSSTTHASAPEQKGFIRGEVKPGSGWRVEPVSGEDNACVYTHISFVDLKGW